MQYVYRYTLHGWPITMVQAHVYIIAWLGCAIFKILRHAERLLDVILNDKNISIYFNSCENQSMQQYLQFHTKHFGYFTIWDFFAVTEFNLQAKTKSGYLYKHGAHHLALKRVSNKHHKYVRKSRKI